METITYSQVQELVKQLPKTKLLSAYRLLQELTNITKQQAQENFFSYSIIKRRRILASQAKKLKSHYEQTTEERKEWQVGEFLDGY